MKLTALSLALCAIAALGIAPAAGAAGGLTPDTNLLAFGSQDIHSGQTPQMNVDLANSTGSDVNVSSVTIGGTDAAAFAIAGTNNCGTVGSGNSCNVAVYFDPSTVGSKSATLSVVDDIGTNDIALTGTGEAGTLSGSAPSFNPQPYFYGSQSQNADFTNASSFAATAFSATITGPDAAFFSVDYNGCDYTLYPGNNCSVGVRFNPVAAGTKTAQLELTNDGTVSPVIVPLSATALSGPNAVLTVPSHDFGTIAVGSSSAVQTFGVSNTGDSPLQVQQLLILSGTPQLFPVTDDACSGQVLYPGGSCTFKAAFSPDRPGERNASVYVISNQSGPVGTIPLTGIGVLTPAGSVALSGLPAAGRKLTCRPQGYSEGTKFLFSWLLGSKTVRGETTSKLTLTDSDVGKRASCRVRATNSVGSQTAASPRSTAIAPRDLSRAGGSLVSQPACRAVQAPSRLGNGVALRAGSPVTPWATLHLSAPGKPIRARIDGRQVASGVGRIAINPRGLNRFANGTHTLEVKAGAREATVRIGLSPCRLAARLEGAPSAPSSVIVSSSAGMTDPVVRLPGRLHRSTSSTRMGRVAVKVARQPIQTFPLFGARTSSNGITVILGRHGIRVKGLPAETGNVRFRFGAGVIEGSRGTLGASANLRGSKGRARTSSPAIWRR